MKIIRYKGINHLVYPIEELNQFIQECYDYNDEIKYREFAYHATLNSNETGSKSPIYGVWAGSFGYISTPVTNLSCKNLSNTYQRVLLLTTDIPVIAQDAILRYGLTEITEYKDTLIYPHSTPNRVHRYNKKNPWSYTRKTPQDQLILNSKGNYRGGYPSSWQYKAKPIIINGTYYPSTSIASKTLPFSNGWLRKKVSQGPGVYTHHDKEYDIQIP